MYSFVLYFYLPNKNNEGEMKKLIILPLMFVCALLSSQSAIDRPKLVIGIVVDQMRWDYLYRYYDRYTDSGFKRLLNEGFSCENTMLNYVPSFTAVGHTTIYTGSVPSIHGITGNDFIIQATGETMYCTQDDNVHSVGTKDRNHKEGKMSPRNMETTTITDELELATNFRSKVIGIALKDRGGILPAGHAADAAYWFDDQSGNWITSSWYMEDLPQWVKDFNNDKSIDKYLNQEWNTLYPIDTYIQSTEDDNEYERSYKGQKKTVFPIDMPELFKKNGYNMIRLSPFGNSLTLGLAKQALVHERMGKHTDTDFLAVSLSITDYIGHYFAVNSIKIEDVYLRLDKELGEFFAFLDKEVGKDNYLLFLTADHAAAHNARFLQDHGINAGNWNEKQVRNDLNNHLKGKFGSDKLVINLYNYQTNFDYKEISAVKVDINNLRQECIDFLQKVEGIAYAFENSKASVATIPAVIKEKVINGYNRERCGEVQVILKPGWYSSSRTKGGTHGTWHPYDAHIPLIWMGWNIKQGSSNKEIYMTDIAPTLAALLHIQMPNGCIGKPIEDIFK